MFSNYYKTRKNAKADLGQGWPAPFSCLSKNIINGFLSVMSLAEIFSEVTVPSILIFLELNLFQKLIHLTPDLK